MTNIMTDITELANVGSLNDTQTQFVGKFGYLPLPMRMRLAADTLEEATTKYYEDGTTDPSHHDWRAVNLRGVAAQWQDEAEATALVEELAKTIYQDWPIPNNGHSEADTDIELAHRRCRSVAKKLIAAGWTKP